MGSDWIMDPILQLVERSSGFIDLTLDPWACLLLTSGHLDQFCSPRSSRSVLLLSVIPVSSAHPGHPGQFSSPRSYRSVLLTPVIRVSSAQPRSPRLVLLTPCHLGQFCSPPVILVSSAHPPVIPVSSAPLGHTRQFCSPPVIPVSTTDSTLTRLI